MNRGVERRLCGLLQNPKRYEHLCTDLTARCCFYAHPLLQYPTSAEDAEADVDQAITLHKAEPDDVLVRRAPGYLQPYLNRGLLASELRRARMLARHDKLRSRSRHHYGQRTSTLAGISSSR